MSILKQLTQRELKEAGAVEIYYLYYEDRFHYGNDRESFAVAVCLSKAEADHALAEKARPVASGYDGYEVVGPCNLADEHRVEVVRDVLRHIGAKLPGPVPIPVELW